jgi:hypothetical protein
MFGNPAFVFASQAGTDCCAEVGMTKSLNYAIRSRDQGAFCFGNEARDDLTAWRQIID